MEITALVIGVIVSLCLSELNPAAVLNGSEDGLKHMSWMRENRTGTGISSESSNVKCKLQGSTRLPAFSLDGNYVIGGVFAVHHYQHTVKDNYTHKPEPQMCTGRLV